MNLRNTYRVFGSLSSDPNVVGNEAAVIKLDRWIDAPELQRRAKQMGLPATVFVVRCENAFEVRSFSPEVEIGLCGHGLLAAAREFLGAFEAGTELNFYGVTAGYRTRKHSNEVYSVCLPILSTREFRLEANWFGALGKNSIEQAEASNGVIVLRFASEEEVRALLPRGDLLLALGKYVVATAEGVGFDYVLRYFRPSLAEFEDAATGSVQSCLADFWHRRLSRREFRARQYSQAGGDMIVRFGDDFVEVFGRVLPALGNESNINKIPIL